MNFTFGDSMCDLTHYIPLAKAAEQFGYRTMSLGDSICYPEEAEGDYPYLETGDRTFLDGAIFPDPFQLISALSVVTEKLIFRTGVLKLPVREPVLGRVARVRGTTQPSAPDAGGVRAWMGGRTPLDGTRLA